MGSSRSLLAFVVALFLVATTARAGEPKWKQHTINGRSEFEAAAVFDVDGDGKLDIVCGDSWYQAPDWKPHHIRDVQRVGTYYNDFATFPLDVNGDGQTDYITASYFGKNVGWVENPQGRSALGLSRGGRPGSQRGGRHGGFDRRRHPRLFAQHGQRRGLV